MTAPANLSTETGAILVGINAKGTASYEVHPEDAFEATSEFT